MTLFSGEWLLTDDDTKYRVAYEGEVVSHWSGGVTWRATRDVVRRVIADQKALAEADNNKDVGRMVLTATALVTYEPSDGEFYVSEVDADGMFQLPSWTWYTVDEDWRVLEVAR